MNAPILPGPAHWDFAARRTKLNTTSLDQVFGFRNPYEEQVENVTHPIWLGDINRPWEEVLHLAAFRTFRKGETLCFPEEDVQHFFYLSKGAVRSLKKDENGQERLILFMRSGTLFNDIIAISNCSRGTYYVFYENAEVWIFDKRSVMTRDFARNHPHLMLNLIGSLGLKGVILTSYTCEMQSLSTMAQLCRLFCTMEKNSEQRTFSGITQQEIASVLNVHRSTVSRLLRELKQRGILTKYTKNELIIADMGRLCALAAGAPLDDNL